MTLWKRRLASEGVTATKPTSIALSSRQVRPELIPTSAIPFNRPLLCYTFQPTSLSLLIRTHALPTLVAGGFPYQPTAQGPPRRGRGCADQERYATPPLLEPQRSQKLGVQWLSPTELHPSRTPLALHAPHLLSSFLVVGSGVVDIAGPCFAYELRNDDHGVAFAFGGIEPGTLHAHGHRVKVHSVHYSVGRAGR